jgi:hypothetical protein
VVAQGFGLQTGIAGLYMSNLKTIAAGAAIACSLGFGALGIATGVANAAPSPVGSGTALAQDAGWGHGGPGWNGGGRGGGGWNGGGRGWNGGGQQWGPPPPNYGYGGYDQGGYGGGGCVSGPLGLLHFCP